MRIDHNKIEHYFAQIVSYIFNPLFIPFLAVIIIFLSGSIFSFYSTQAIRWILLITGIGTIVIPVFSIQILLFLRYINDFQMENRKERIIPYTLVLLSYIFTYFILKKIEAPSIFKGIILATIISLSLNILVLFFWKISSHALGAGGLLALTLLLYTRWYATHFTFLYAAILLSGMICSARLIVKAHNETQIYVGALTGFIIVILVLGILV